MTQQDCFTFGGRKITIANVCTFRVDMLTYFLKQYCKYCIFKL